MAEPRDVQAHPLFGSPTAQPAGLPADSAYRDDAHAVIIGINQYQDPAIRKLEYARADAEAMYKVLTDAAIGHFKKECVTLLVDENATEKRIKAAIGTHLPSQAKAQDTVFVYFAGHGAPFIDPRGRAAD